MDRIYAIGDDASKWSKFVLLRAPRHFYTNPLTRSFPLFFLILISPINGPNGDLDLPYPWWSVSERYCRVQNKGEQRVHAHHQWLVPQYVQGIVSTI